MIKANRKSRSERSLAGINFSSSSADVLAAILFDIQEVKR